MKKFLLFTIILTPLFLFSQKRAWRWMNGELCKEDTSIYKTIGSMKEFTGYGHLHMNFVKGEDWLVLYAPLSNKPIVAFVKDSIELQQALKKFDYGKYVLSYDFEYDFKKCRDELNFTKDSVIKYLGEPSSIESSDRYFQGELYHYGSNKYAFDLYFESGRPMEFKRYNTAALKNDMVIEDYGLKLDDDYVKGFRLSVFNNTAKKIKYFYVTVTAYNAVDDKIATKTTTAIGPVASKESGSYTFDNLFFSKIIETLKITNIKILYFDGTTKIYTGAAIRPLFFEYD